MSFFRYHSLFAEHGIGTGTGTGKRWVSILRYVLYTLQRDSDRDGDSAHPIPCPCPSCFYDFVFKNRLIRLGFSYQKILYLKSQPTDSQSGVLITTLQSQL